MLFFLEDMISVTNEVFNGLVIGSSLNVLPKNLVIKFCLFVFIYFEVDDVCIFFHLFLTILP